uniref:NADH dehydrogenase subunit 5 n=1 Tax=Parasacculina shiinoi TaxID=2836419 RepID=UPI002551D89B|nr:NADH dehydrogenase subunit 5 [Parasacculina shiinoi]WGU20870.1 NADH dehydrogenase subunit 5 [Parasacculina shiinoi]
MLELYCWFMMFLDYIYLLCVYLFFFFFFFMMMYLYIGSLSMLISCSYVFMYMKDLLLDFSFLFDSCCFSVAGLVSFISFVVIIYINYYMIQDLNYILFLNLVYIFVLGMLLFLFSSNIFSVLFGWDALGFVSYLLVIYFNNLKSLNSGVYTIMMNRVGDYFILMSLGLSIYIGSFDFMSSYLVEGSMSMFILFLVLLGSMTKSAQLPFSSWLPKAMMAPTPVSSLVHSSTLVVAGIFLVSRIVDDLYMLKYLILFFSFLTGFLSSFKMFYECDLKKLVAMTTLIQLSFMMLSLGFGMKFMSLYHLMLHAIYKSILFMSSGYLIYISFNNQNVYYNYGGSLNCPLFVSLFILMNLSSLGFPFFGGFYSKDMILGLLFMTDFNLFFLYIFLMIIFFTVLSSLRMLDFIFYISVYNFKVKVSLLSMNFVLYLFSFFMLFSGFMFSWNFNNFELLDLVFWVKFSSIYMLLIGFSMYCVLICINYDFFFFIYLLNIIFLEYLYSYYTYYMFIDTFFSLGYLDSWINKILYVDFLDCVKSFMLKVNWMVFFGMSLLVLFFYL